MNSFFIVGDLQETLNNIKLLTVVMEMQEWIRIAHLSSNQIFHTAVNSIHILKSLCRMPNFII
jgi:hypothetical protein